MHQKIGIVGFGTVGKSALHFIQASMHADCYVWDERILTSYEQGLIRKHSVTHVRGDSSNFENFLQSCDSIIVSPGIDKHLYEHHIDKVICELDLFSQHFFKPTIAITGTLGKTSVARMLTHCLRAYVFNEYASTRARTMRVALAGNIGRGMLDIIDEQDHIDLGILELSSFQLELSSSFAPDIALITNMYPNHLDRHRSFEAYIDAKFNLLLHQNKKQIALVPALFVLDSTFSRCAKILVSVQSHICYVHLRRPTFEEWGRLNDYRATIFFVDDGKLFVTQLPFTNGDERCIVSLRGLPDIGYHENWLFVVCTLYLLGCDVTCLESDAIKEIQLDPHRVEKCAMIDGVDFYDDSKATIMQATIAAVNKLATHKRPIILMVGGLGKGIDRLSHSKNLRKNKRIKRIVCFGKECNQFEGCEAFASLESAVDYVMSVAWSGDQVLFSPGGTSFDLFDNYKQRGEAFKELVRSYGERKKSA